MKLTKFHMVSGLAVCAVLTAITVGASNAQRKHATSSTLLTDATTPSHTVVPTADAPTPITLAWGGQPADVWQLLSLSAR